MLNMMQVFFEPFYRRLIVSNLAISVLVMIYINCTEHEISWELAYVNFVKSLSLGDDYVVDHERMVTFTETFFVNCHTKFLLA